MWNELKRLWEAAVLPRIPYGEFLVGTTGHMHNAPINFYTTS